MTPEGLVGNWLGDETDQPDLVERIRAYGDARFKDGLEAAIVEFCGTVCHCRTAERIRSLAAQPPPEEK